MGTGMKKRHEHMGIVLGWGVKGGGYWVFGKREAGRLYSRKRNKAGWILVQFYSPSILVASYCNSTPSAKLF